MSILEPPGPDAGRIIALSRPDAVQEGMVFLTMMQVTPEVRRRSLRASSVRR